MKKFKVEEISKTDNFAFLVKVVLGLESTDGYVAMIGLMGPMMNRVRV